MQNVFVSMLRIHTCMREYIQYMSVRACVCVCVSGHVVGSEGEQELTDMLTSQNTLWCINIHTRLCTLINLPREAAAHGWGSAGLPRWTLISC